MSVTENRAFFCVNRICHQFVNTELKNTTIPIQGNVVLDMQYFAKVNLCSSGGFIYINYQKIKLCKMLIPDIQLYVRAKQQLPTCNFKTVEIVQISKSKYM